MDILELLLRDLNRLTPSQLTTLIFLLLIGIGIPWVTILVDYIQRKRRTK